MTMEDALRQLRLILSDYQLEDDDIKAIEYAIAALQALMTVGADSAAT